MNKFFITILFISLTCTSACQNSKTSSSDRNSISHIPKNSIDAAKHVNDLANARNAEIDDQMNDLFADDDSN